jgi:hypothetical protein
MALHSAGVRAGPLPLAVCLVSACALAGCGSSSGAQSPGTGGASGGASGAGGRAPSGMLLGTAGGPMLDCLPSDKGAPVTGGAAGASGVAPAAGCVDRPRKMPYGRMGIGAATAPDGLVYLISWRSATGPDCVVSPINVYDPGNDTYRALASPPIPVGTLPPAAFAAGKLVMIFGDTYLYDPATNSWSQGRTSPRGQVLDAVTVTLGDRVYVFGGRDDDTTVNEAQIYDPATDQWEALPSSPTNSGGYSGAAVGGKIYLLGPTAVVFDPNLGPAPGTWTTLPRPSRPRINAGVAGEAGGKVLLIGGFDGLVKIEVVEAFDPATGSWSDRAALMPRPTFLSGVAPACAGSRIFVFGGDGAGLGASNDFVQVYGPGDAWTLSSPTN